MFLGLSESYKMQVILAEMEMGHGLYEIDESGSGAADRAEGCRSYLRDGGQMPEWYIWG